jgi:hypothetical protein
MTGTRPAPARVALPNATDRAVVRAAYGLVADEYAVVGHTPNVTRDEARELCLAVGVGDLTTAVDDALSFLDVPTWGLVCTRYTTERDARGRVALASDSVAVDADTFASLRSDPFRCFPRRQDRPTSAGELSVPHFSASAPTAEAQRLADARRSIDEPQLLRPLLAALLAGERVLYVAAHEPLPLAALQCLVLLLPPSLRRLMTFQTIAAQSPRHAPRLTIADRRYADFASVHWTRELPRQSRDGDGRAERTADAMLALSPEALAAAHALYQELAPATAPRPAMLLDEIEQVARYGALSHAVAEGDAAAAIRTMGSPRDAGETQRLLDLAIAALGTPAVGRALLAPIADMRPEALGASAVVAAELARRVSRGDAPAAEAMRTALGTSDGVRWPDDDRGARAVRAALATAAAWLGDAPRLARLAEADAPWPACASERPGALTPATRTSSNALGALVRASDGDADRTAAALDALRTLAAESPATRADVGPLALALARRAFAAHGMAGAPEPLDRIADALDAFWAAVAPVARDEPLRALLRGTDARGDGVQRLAAAGASEAELAGWLGAATLRAMAADGDVQPLVTALASGAPRPAIGAALGRVLRAAAPTGTPLRAAWPALLAHLDMESRRELLVRALGRVVDGDGRELAETCAALADIDFALDAAAIETIAPGLTRWAQRIPATRGGAARLTGALATLAVLADAPEAAALVTRVLVGAPAALRELVQLRRLAAAALEIEATRDPDTWAARRAAVTSASASAGAGLLPAGERRLLHEFFGIGSDGLLARFRRGRAPNGNGEVPR